MKKTFITVTLIITLMLSAVIMASCTGGLEGLDINNIVDSIKEASNAPKVTNAIKGESIQFEDTVIYMSPKGNNNTYQLNPIILPADATDKSVVYQMMSAGDAKYVTINSSGLLEAKSEKPDNESVTIRVFLKTDRSIYVDLIIYVQVVSVSKISFETPEVSVVLGAKTTTAIKPILDPINATVGGSLIYESLNEDVCKVDSLGNLIPVSVGQTTIEVSTPAASYEEPIVGRITVNVTYADLAYNLNAVSDTARFKQIYNQAETVELSLVCYDDLCDQNPTIIWYCDDNALNAFRNNKLCSYKPDSVPVGSHKIYAKLTDASGRVEYTTKYDLYIYNALTNIDLDFTNGEAGTFTENDIVSIKVGVLDGQYPPEQYNWYLKGMGKNGTDKLIGSTTEGRFNYRIEDSGDLIIICEPVIKGITRSDLRKEKELGTVGELNYDGCEIYGMYIEGAKDPGSNEYVPFVYWDALGRCDADITVQVQVGDTITDLCNYTGNYTGCFTQYGCYIPASIATLNTNFAVRVGTDGFASTDFVTYGGGTITPAKYKYLDFIVPGMNGYISNMEELGKLLNYINVFRPQYLYQTSAENTIIPGYEGYSLKLSFAFEYADLNKTMYPVMSESTDTKESYRNVHNLISSAFNCYCESGQFSYVRTVSDAGDVGLVLVFGDLPTSLYETQGTGLSEVYLDQSYAKTMRVADVLPVDNVDYTINVSTTNQLYYALTLGYRPLPVAGSAAETIYAKMRATLRRICGNDMTDAEKIHAIYDFLSTEVVYDYAATTITDPDLQRRAEAFCLEGVFLRGRAVCDGIAKSFNALCRMEGITAIKVIGVETRNNVGHAWNKVMVDGEWYGIDATWGSSKSNSEEYQNHSYLLTTDAVLNLQHISYGSYPTTVNKPSDIYYGAEVASGITRVITSATEVSVYTETIISPALASAGSTFSAEIKLQGLTYDAFKVALGKSIGNISYTIFGITFADGAYYVIIRRS